MSRGGMKEYLEVLYRDLQHTLLGVFLRFLHYSQPSSPCTFWHSLTVILQGSLKTC